VRVKYIRAKCARGKKGSKGLILKNYAERAKGAKKGKKNARQKDEKITVRHAKIGALISPSEPITGTNVEGSDRRGGTFGFPSISRGKPLRAGSLVTVSPEE